MDQSTDSGDAIRRLEELVGQLSARVERLEAELTAKRSSDVVPEESPELFSLRKEPVPAPAAPRPAAPSVPPPLPSAAVSRPSPPPSRAFPERVARISESFREAEPLPSASPVVPANALPPADEERLKAAMAEFDTKSISGKPKPKGDLETRIVTYWFPRIGLGLIALMFVYVAQLYSRGPWPKLAFGYSVAVALAAAGIWQRRRQPIWAEPVIAGGLGLSYFMTYSMGFVRPMKVVDSLTLEIALLSINVILVLAVAQWLRSEVVAGVALVLGYVTTGVSGTERYALVSVGLLSVAAVAFMTVNRWVASTVVAVVATYVAHLYVYLVIDRPKTGTPGEVFWHHATHLTAYFAVFAIGAALAQRRVLEAEATDEASAKEPKPESAPTAQLLAAVVQVNIGLFVSGMIFLLRQTGVYWDQAWLFFFPLAAVAYGLSRVHAPLAGARTAYQLAAAVGLTFGIIAAASPAWLPVLLSAQAIGMLLLAARERSLVWGGISLAVLLYAGLEMLLPRQVGVLGLSPPAIVPMAWWTVMAVTVLYLGYAGTLQRRADPLDRKRTAGVGHFVCTIAAVIYAWGIVRYLTPSDDEAMAILWAGPLVAAAAVTLRLSVWLTFTLTLSVIGALAIGMQSLGGSSLGIVPLAVFAPLGIGAGLALEKLGTGDAKADRRCSTALYLTVHIVIAALLGRQVPGEWFVAAEVATALGTVLLAVITGSRLLFWSALIPSIVAVLAFLAQWFRFPGAQLSPEPLLAAGLLTVLLAALFGTPAVGRKVGEAADEHHQPMTEFMVMLAAGAMITLWGYVVFGPTFFLVVALFGALLTVGAILTGRSMLVGVGFFFLIASALVLGSRTFDVRGAAEGARMAWSAIATALLLVGTERIIAHRNRLRLGGSRSPGDPVMSDETANLLGSWIAVGGMAVLLLGVYAHPSVRSFYLSAAIVGAGFAWIVLGLLFKSGIYRKVGIGVVCFAVVKALGYDTRRLSRELQIVSLGILGGVLLLAGWLYSRYRTRLMGEPESDGESRPDRRMTSDDGARF